MSKSASEIRNDIYFNKMKTESNSRFVKKNLVLNFDTVDALLTYIENDGTITVCKPGRRTRANTSFPLIKGTVAHRGAKVNNLRNSGHGKANGA